MLKAHQVKPYDDAAKSLGRVAEMLAAINIAGLNAEDVDAITGLLHQTVCIKNQLFRQAHERFVAERRGEVGAGK